jgi:hypothetical protein
MRLPTCNDCGGHDIFLDAWAEYDSVTEDWVLQNTFDHSYCNSCEGTCSWEWENVPDPPTADELQAQLTELQREFDILDNACDFWKDTAIELGYKE